MPAGPNRVAEQSAIDNKTTQRESLLGPEQVHANPAREQENQIAYASWNANTMSP